MARLLRNAIRTPDGTVLESRTRHDYVEYTDTVSGNLYIVDGGLDYIRRSVNGDEEVLVLDETAPHTLLRELVTWGTFGSNGTDKLRYVPIKDMTNSHIENVLKDCPYAYPQILNLLREELEYRDSFTKSVSMNNLVDYFERNLDPRAFNSFEELEKRALESAETLFGAL